MVTLLLFFSGLVLGWLSHSDPRPVAFPAVPELAARCARHKARAPKIPRANPNHPGTSHPPVGNYWYSYETLEKMPGINGISGVYRLVQDFATIHSMSWVKLLDTFGEHEGLAEQSMLCQSPICT